MKKDIKSTLLNTAAMKQLKGGGTALCQDKFCVINAQCCVDFYCGKAGSQRNRCISY